MGRWSDMPSCCGSAYGCNCVIVSGGGLTVTGSGTLSTPYVLTSPGAAPYNEDVVVSGLINTVGSATDVALRKHYPRVYTPEEFGAVGDGTTDDTTAVSNAFTAANALRTVGTGGNIWHPGATVHLSKTYKLTTLAAPIVVSCNVTSDGGSLTTVTGYASTVLIVGHDTTGYVLHDADIQLPNVLGATPVSAHTAGSVGVRVQNLTHSRVKFGRVIFYETGHRYTGKGIGTAYNTIHPGWVDFCKVGWRFDSNTDGLGWANQNTFMGGGISQSTVWGLVRRATGWRHIVMEGGTGNLVHANTFVGCSFEGNLSDIHFAMHTAAENQWIGATRFETGDLGLPVTVSAAFNSFTAAGHGLAVGDKVFFYADAMPAPLVFGTPYWVVGVSGDDFFINTTKGGGGGYDITTSGTNVKVIIPPRIFSDNTAGTTYGNRIGDGYNTWPGAIELVTAGTAGPTPRTAIDF